MSFLQPWMLIALPLAAIPIIIHLINQRRYQTTQWAAMMFLLAANRMNRGYARIRQWLILAFRAAVIAALVFAVGRPLVSGSLGGGIVGSVFSQGSSAAIVLVDRSPSMRARAGASAQSKLDIGVAQIAESLKTLGAQRVVLIESNRATPIELESPDELVDSPHVGPSDASADIPGMLLAALDYINENSLGQTDIWICSDLRRHDWRADDGRWPSLREAYAEFGRRVRFRVLAMDEANEVNRQIRIQSARLVGDGEFVSVSLQVQNRSADANASDTAGETRRELLPVSFDLLGNRSSVEVELQNGVGELTDHRIALPSDQARGYGSVTIPADVNAADNQFFFTFDQAPVRRCVIVSDDDEVARVLKLAAEIATDEESHNAAEVISTGQVGSIQWDQTALVLWHAPLPQPDAEQAGNTTAIESFVDRGGRIVFLPPTKLTQHDASRRLFSVAWNRWQELSEHLAVSTWRSDTDVLAATLAGTALPLGELKVRRYASLTGETTPLAKLANGTPLVCRVPTRRGGVYVCTTTPAPQDSSLATDGVVLYVLVQRLLAAGAESLGEVRQSEAGESDNQSAMNWRRVAGDDQRLSVDNAFASGIYSQGEDKQLIAVNRSGDEDHALRVDEGQIEQLFDGLVYDQISGNSDHNRSLVEEAWRAFLMIMLAAMIGEALLCLPKVKSYETADSAGGSKKQPQPATELVGSSVA